MFISIRSLVPLFIAGTFMGGMQNGPLADAAKLAPVVETPCHSGGHHHLPKFGFSSRTVYGVGEQVVRVRCRGLAANMGLKRGDIILALNGMPLTFRGAWNHALQDAVDEDGWVQLEIQDVDTGGIAYRQTRVAGYGPVTSKQGMVGRGPPVVVSTVGPTTGKSQKEEPSPHHSQRNAESQKGSNSWKRITVLGEKKQ